MFKPLVLKRTFERIRSSQPFNLGFKGDAGSYLVASKFFNNKMGMIKMMTETYSKLSETVFMELWLSFASLTRTSNLVSKTVRTGNRLVQKYHINKIHIFKDSFHTIF